MTRSRDDLVVLWADAEVQGWTALPRGMGQALCRLGLSDVLRQKMGLTKKLARACKWAGLLRQIAPMGKRRLVTLSWASDVGAFPDAFWCEIVPWNFDCWGQDWDKWEKMLRRQRVKLAFFSARSSAEHFARVIPGLQTRWLPEAMDLSLLYPGKPLAERTLHVLEMGRRYAPIHEQIREPLKQAGKTHVYDPPGGKPSGAIVGLDALYRRMGDAAVVMCYPKAMTHPAGAGGVETMTQRYLETMGSGSLVVGHCPRELEDLYGFNPVVELSNDRAGDHLLEILGSLGKYQPLVDRALAKTKELGGFDVRAAEMLRMIDEYDRSKSGAAGR